MMVLLWVSLAMAGTLTIGVPEGHLRSQMENTVHVASADEDGRPRAIAPILEIDGERVTPAGLVKKGVWAYRFMGPLREGLLSIRAETEADRREWVLPVEAVSAPLFVVDPVRVRSKAQRVQLIVRGQDVPPPDALDVYATEGRVLSVKVKGETLAVDLELSQIQLARQVLVGLRDKRTQARPVFTTIDVSQEIRMQYQAEAGSTLWVDIGRRRMGPFPEKDGFVSAVFEQRFGDWQAQVEIEDDLGNRSRAVERLPKPEKPNVLFVPMGRLTAHAQAIDLYILAQGEGGRPQGALKMSCQTPRVGALELVRVQEGLWHTRLQLSRDAIQSLPVRCDAFGFSYATRLSAPQGVARNLRVRAYPEQISTDFPLSDIQAKVEDAYGTPLGVGPLSLTVERGILKESQSSPMVRTWEYMGAGDAVQAGADVLLATYGYPMGNGSHAALLMGHDFVPKQNRMVLYGRAMDENGLPLEGVTLHLSAGDEAAAVRTDRFGWAQASVTVPEGSDPIAAVVHSEHLQRQMVLFRGEGRSEYHPARADIREEVALRFRIGRISRIAVDVDPPILYASNGAEARVRVRFMDSAGNLVPDEFPMLEATEGVFGSIVAAGEGVYEATYVPTESGRSRLVQITARSPSGRISMVRNLAIEPEPVARSLSVSFGGLSNFGRVNTLMGGIAFQQRLGLWDKRLLLQVGALGWSQTAEVPTPSSLDAGYFTRLTLVPIHVGLVARQEWGMVSGSLALAGVLAPGVSFERFGQDAGYSKLLFLPPGFKASTGVSYRFNVGELYSELAGLFLYRPGGQGGLQKQVGGMVFLVGYRFILD